MELDELYSRRKNIQEEEEFLLSYSIENYFRPSVSADVVAFTIGEQDEDNYRKESGAKLLLLLVKRGEHPFKDSWALPGGFMREDESMEECAYREIVEETNIKPSSLKSVGVFSDCRRDPRGRILSNAFTSIIYDGANEYTSGKDAADAKWFEIELDYQEGIYYLRLANKEVKISAVLKETKNEFGIKRFEIVESEGLAFDHGAIIGTALFSLRKDVLDFDILFDFLPEKFTLSKLQKVQETILNKAILPANFRRKIADYVEETEEFETGAGHRPAKLFKRKAKKESEE